MDGASIAAMLEILLAAMPDLEASAVFISEFELLEKYINTDTFRGVATALKGWASFYVGATSSHARWVLCATFDQLYARQGVAGIKLLYICSGV